MISASFLKFSIIIIDPATLFFLTTIDSGRGDMVVQWSALWPLQGVCIFTLLSVKLPRVLTGVEKIHTSGCWRWEVRQIIVFNICLHFSNISGYVLSLRLRDCALIFYADTELLGPSWHLTQLVLACLSWVWSHVLYLQSSVLFGESYRLVSKHCPNRKK